MSIFSENVNIHYNKVFNLQTHLKIVATVRYLPWRGSHATIMFRASNICLVRSATVVGRYWAVPRAFRGPNPGMKKWRRGKGTCSKTLN